MSSLHDKKNNPENFIKTEPLSAYIFLQDNNFDLDDILLNLKSIWNIKVNRDLDYYYQKPHLIMFGSSGYFAAIEFRQGAFESEAPVSIAAAKYGADSEFSRSMQSHLSYITVVLWGRNPPKENVSFHTKLVSAVNHRPTSAGVFMYNDIFERADFEQQSSWLKEGLLPVQLWVLVSRVEVRKDLCMITTNGMRRFGSMEFQISVHEPDSEKLKLASEFAVNLCLFVIDGSKRILDGETVGFRDMGAPFDKIAVKVGSPDFSGENDKEVLKMSI